MAKSAAQVPLDASMRIAVLYGAERFLVEERTRRFAEALQERFGGLEQFAFDGLTVEPAVVLDELRSYGLMQRHKLVILDSAEVFLAGGKGAPDEDDDGGDDDDDTAGAGGGGAEEAKSPRRPLMERYAQSPSPDATLLMRATTWRKANLDKIIIKAGGAVVECETQSTEQAVEWSMKRCAKRYNASVERDAAALLVQRIGPQLQRLDTELLKLASMAGEGGTITRALVAANTPASREEKAWEIQSAVASGSAAQMLGKLRDLTAISRHDAVPLSWAVIDLLRKEHAAAHLLRRGVPPRAVAGQVRLWGESAEPVLEAARRTPPHRLAQLLRDAVESDRHSKSGVGDPVRNLETLLVKIADTTVGSRRGR